jgi:uncharacterized protein (DUF488 family)
MNDKRIIYTIGHSNHTAKEFLEILRAFGIQKLIDVRTIPRSRHNPQFNQERLKAYLKKAGITYLHINDLGGLRHASKDSRNTAWTNLSFRGYADYMQTEEFQAGLARLLKSTPKKATAIMCAEAVPWRCHRSLIGDALLVRGVAVEDIFSKSNSKPHTLTPWAKVRGQKITYPAADPPTNAKRPS